MTAPDPATNDAAHDWADIARNVGFRRSSYIQRGDDYTTADANALRDQFQRWAEVVARVDDYARWSRKDGDAARAAERAAADAQHEAARLRTLIDAGSVQRLTAIAETLAAVPASKTATHNDDCWTKHPGCLAARIRRQLNGQEA